MSDLQPVVWLLTGMPGSGKTTFAKALARGGVVRLSVDDQMTARHGRIGKDHAEHEHLALQAPVIEDVRRQLVALLREGRSVVLDHGLAPARSGTSTSSWSRSMAPGGGSSTSRLITMSCCGDWPSGTTNRNMA
ncbi:AAA family ATPase [Streptomyces sp. BE133]|uniref:AAA family ATPase n=1 Tax=Streptomyces sp. BE133 TaxID=3002523 RepID=UPI003FA6A664